MKTLCIGNTGALGREVAKLTTDSVGHINLDISCRSQVRAVLERYRPDVVINCVGIVKGREVPETAYIQVNALGPWQLRYECEHVGAKLLHVSTDCVFSGNLKYPSTYHEGHIPNPTDIYGRSKLLGEAGHITVRTSFIGPGKYGLVQWLTTTPKTTVVGYTNSMWSGLTSPVLAEVLLQVANNMELPSIVHVHGECVSKLALLGMLNKHLKLNKTIVASETPVSNRCLSSKYAAVMEVPMLPDMIARLAPCRS